MYVHIVCVHASAKKGNVCSTTHIVRKFGIQNFDYEISFSSTCPWHCDEGGQILFLILYIYTMRAY